MQSLSLKQRQEAMAEIEADIAEADVEFWSKNFNEQVFRFCKEGFIPYEIAQKFLNTENGFILKILSSTNGFTKNKRPIYLMH